MTDSHRSEPATRDAGPHVDSKSVHAKYPGWVQLGAIVGGSLAAWGVIALVAAAIRAHF